MYLLVRNDDGYPVIYGIFYDLVAAKVARDVLGRGDFIRRVRDGEVLPYSVLSTSAGRMAYA